MSFDSFEQQQFKILTFKFKYQTNQNIQKIITPKQTISSNNSSSFFSQKLSGSSFTKMESFKQSRSELSTMMKEFNNQRKQSLKSIKSFYSQIESKQANIFDNALQRLQLNLHNFKQNKYKKMHSQIDNGAITQKYQSKLEKIDQEISKLNSIIKNGCGKIVEKPITSRISINSVTHLGNDSKRDLDEQNSFKTHFIELESQNSELSLQHIEQRIKDRKI